MGFAEDLRKMSKDMSETVAATHPGPLSREEAEKFKAKLGEFMTKLDSMADQLGAHPIVDPALVGDAKRKPGGPHGDR